jgi:hypothetical protein
MTSGIGFSSISSSGLRQQSNTVADFREAAIGGGALAVSASNLGNTLNGPLVVVAGTGYTPGTYTIDSVGGGMPNGTGAVLVEVTAGGLVTARIVRAGNGFTSAPTFPTAGIPAGTGATITATVGLDSPATLLGTGIVAPKGGRYLTAVGNVANNAAVSGGYLNRSGRAMVAGESVWAVQP